jgi:hypothetical protein
MVIVGRVFLVIGRSCLYYPVSAAAEAEERSDTETVLLKTSFEAFGNVLRDCALLFVTVDMAIRATKLSWRLRLGSLTW